MNRQASCLDLFLRIREAEADGYPTVVAVLIDTTRIAIDVPAMP